MTSYPGAPRRLGGVLLLAITLVTCLRSSTLSGREELPPPAATSAVDEPQTTERLTADEQSRFAAGQRVYSMICVACHQADGQGGERLAASLVQSPFVLDAPEIPVRIVLHGKQGEVGLMPPLRTTLSDEQIANVLTFIRRSWGHTASAITPDFVREQRAATSTRKTAWTEDELLGGR